MYIVILEDITNRKTRGRITAKGFDNAKIFAIWYDEEKRRKFKVVKAGASIEEVEAICSSRAIAKFKKQKKCRKNKK